MNWNHNHHNHDNHHNHGHHGNHGNNNWGATTDSSNNGGGDYQSTYYWRPTTSQIIITVILTIWMIVYIIPNVFLIAILGKLDFRQKNFYFAIRHWCLANLLQMVYAGYLIYVPEEYGREQMYLGFFIYHWIVSGVVMLIAIGFVFDKFLENQRFCRTIIRSNWSICIVAMIILGILVYYDLLTETTVAIGFVVTGSITVLIFIARIIHFMWKGSKTKNYDLRLLISAICIFNNYIYIILLIVQYLVGLPVSMMFVYISLVIVLANGWINLTVLYMYDREFRAETKNFLKKMKEKLCRRKLDSAIEEIEEAASSEENKYEPPPRYSIATQTPIVYDETKQKPAMLDESEEDPPSYEEIARGGDNNRIVPNQDTTV